MTSLTRRFLIPVFGLCAVTLSLSACSDARRAFGWEKAPPDEFEVVQRAPLSLPPDYQLRPPVAGVPRPQEDAPRETARAVLTGAAASRAPSTQIDGPGRTAGEVALLRRAGADQANPEIRQVVNQETSAVIAADKGFVNRLLFWQDSAKDEELNAPQEAKRLKENQALGQPANTGEPPLIQRKKKGWLEGIF